LVTRSRSPFKPGFGSSPPILAGRSDLIEAFADGLVDFVTPGMDEYVREHTVIEELHLIRDSQGT